MEKDFKEAEICLRISLLAPDSIAYYVFHLSRSFSLIERIKVLTSYSQFDTTMLM